MQEAPEVTRLAAAPVAVIVTVYNKAPFVRACLQSVLAQTHPAMELVVVDDGSTDDSWSIVESTTAGSSAQLMKLPNGGVSKARNRGFEACRTRPKYLLFLDADDNLLPDAVAQMVAYLDRHAAAAMCYSIPMLIDENGRELGVDTDQIRWAATASGRRLMDDNEAETPLEAIWARFRAMPSACLVRTSAFEKTGRWDPSLCRPARPFQAEDKDMAIQLALTGPVHRIGVTTVQYRVLPTVHRLSLYEGLLAVDRKWWNAKLDAQTRSRVRDAIRFDSRVFVMNAAEELRSALGAGSLRRTVAAARQWMRGAARLLLLPLRLRPA